LIGLAGGVGSAVSALVGATALLVFGRVGAANYAQNLFHWWMGDMIGIVMVTPLVLVWRHLPGVRLGLVRLVESGALLSLAFLGGQVVFVGWLETLLGAASQGYWLLMMVAIVLRLGRHGVVLVLPLFAVQGLLGALHGNGIFASDIAQGRLVNYWLYMMALSIVGMVLATYLAELKQLQFELKRRQASYYHQFADNSVMMLLMDPKGRIVDANQAALRFYGYSQPRLLSMHISEISVRTEREVQQSIALLMRPGGTQFESRHRLADGSVRDVSVSSSPTVLDDQPVVHTIVFDITDRKRAEAEIENLAFFDPLTRLPNRRLLLDRLHQALAASARTERQGALLFIDLDNFKTLNDTYGHDKGDLLLQQAAQRLGNCIRQSDTVARLGGDEFVVMLKDMSSNPAEAATQAEAVGTKVLAALKQPYQLAAVEHHSSASVGITLFGGSEDTVDELFKRADMALYQAKAVGRNAVRFFDPGMQAAMAARVALEVDLRQGLQQEQFVLHYQAQVNAQGQLTGAEVLARWQHPQRGMVPPMQFIGLAEETGLILPLGHWVLKTACLQLAQWASRPETAQLTLSVNVSARQFHQPEFVQEVLGLIERTGAPAQRLKLELTESLLVDDVDDIIAKMTELKARGVGFSLDDFGTGYSSLSYLKRLPLDQLKIDQSFVRDALTDPNDAAIARTIVALGQSLGLTVIAEGVETQAQRDFLWASGCFAYQGYFFGRPGPVAALDAFIDISII